MTYIPITTQGQHTTELQNSSRFITFALTVHLLFHERHVTPPTCGALQGKGCRCLLFVVNLNKSNKKLFVIPVSLCLLGTILSCGLIDTWWHIERVCPLFCVREQGMLMSIRTILFLIGYTYIYKLLSSWFGHRKTHALATLNTWRLRSWCVAEYAF